MGRHPRSHSERSHEVAQSKKPVSYRRRARGLQTRSRLISFADHRWWQTRFFDRGGGVRDKWQQVKGRASLHSAQNDRVAKRKPAWIRNDRGGALAATFGGRSN
jgi:hypothetical protein